jgi:hypothetical protein
MTEPKNYQPAEIKIRYYPRHELYTAGTKARIEIGEMIGVKDGQVVPLEDPDGKPYLAIANKSTRRGVKHWYAVTEEDYYELDGRYDYKTKKWSFQMSERRRVSKLTELHQAVAKRVIDDYMKEKMNEVTSV